jgi:hypothetical protein
MKKSSTKTTPNGSTPPINTDGIVRMYLFFLAPVTLS